MGWRPDGPVSLICFTRTGAGLLKRLASRLQEDGICSCGYIKSRIAEGGGKREFEEGMGLFVVEEPLTDWVGKRFAPKGALIFIGAAGIAVRASAKWIRDKFRDPAVVVVDEKGALARFREEPGVIYLQGGAEAEDWRRACEKSGPEKAGAPGIGVLIGNLGYFCRFLYKNSPDREEKIRFWEQAARGKGPVGFLAGIYHPERDYEAAGTGFFREMITWQQGIHLGGNAADQRALSFDDLSYALQSRREAPGTGYLKEGAGSSTCRIRVPS